MTIKKQKIIKFIPIIQFITMFFWIKYYQKNNIKYNDFFKTMLKMFAFLLVMNIPRMLLHFIFKSDLLDNIIFYICIYPYFLGLASLAVDDQEQHEKNSTSKKANIS